MSEWKEYKLGEVAEIIPGFAFKSKDFGSKGELVIKIKDIIPPYIDLSNSDRVDLTNYDMDKLKKYLLSEGDYVVAMTGATIGKVGKMKTDQKAYLNQRVAKIKAKDGFCDDFVYYSINGDDFQTFIQNNIDSNSAQENISANSIARFPVMLPSLEVQHRIASILISLDDKIDLLRRENATLEAMAETLFRQWFVVEAKEEWEEKPLKEVVDIAIGRTPPRKESKWFSTNPNDIKWLSIKDMGGDSVFLFNTSEYLTKEAVEVFSIPIIPKSTVVLSFKMTVGRVGITTEDMLSNEAIAHFKFKDDTPFSKEYLYLFLRNYRYDTLGTTSSIVTAINSAMIKNLKIAVPDADIMERFKNQAQPIFDKIYSNQEQINTLVQTRDGLLPRLMSNEIAL